VSCFQWERNIFTSLPSNYWRCLPTDSMPVSFQNYSSTTEFFPLLWRNSLAQKNYNTDVNRKSIHFLPIPVKAIYNQYLMIKFGITHQRKHFTSTITHYTQMPTLCFLNTPNGIFYYLVKGFRYGSCVLLLHQFCTTLGQLFNIIIFLSKI
jgi:hypothetical protein